MHITKTRDRIKILNSNAKKLKKEAKILRTILLMENAANVRENEAKRLKEEAETLKPLARLEDLHIWQMKKVKTSKNGFKEYVYWMATWRENGKTRNVHLGSIMKMDSKAALLKARMLKKEAIKC